MIRTDHESIKHLLEQKLHTYLQFKGISKLLGLDYTIMYKKGKENKVADALSRQHEEQQQLMAISVVVPTWVKEVEASYQGDDYANHWLPQLSTSTPTQSKLKLIKGILYYQDRIYVGKGAGLRRKILQEFQNSPLGGHSGIQSTISRIQHYFYWPGLTKEVTEWIKACDTCQRCKSENVAYPGYLQPLPIPHQAWKDITMDFIEQLPRSEGKDTILVVVDRLTKTGHFIALTHPFYAAIVAKAFLNNIYKLHGMPSSIVSDRDRIFTGTFGQEFMKLSGTQLLFSSAYHPQTDGQSERLNQCLEVCVICIPLNGIPG